MKISLRWPGLGGWLAVLNGVLWILFLVIIPIPCIPDPMPFVIEIALSLPLALPIMILSHAIPDLGAALVACVAIGINTLAWGYGMAWLCRRLRRCPPHLLLLIVVLVAVLMGLVMLLVELTRTS